MSYVLVFGTRSATAEKVERALINEERLRKALEHIESVCVAGLTHDEALNTVTWARERAKEALEQEV